MKLRLPTNLSETALNTCPTHSAVGSGVSGIGSPPFLNAVRGGPWSGLRASSASASSNSETPIFFFAEVQKTGMTVPAASALGSVASNSSLPTSPSPRYFSMSTSSASTTASSNCERAATRSTGQPGAAAGGSRTLTTPLKLGPGLTGALNSTQPLPKVSRMALKTSMNLTLSPSILLMTTMRARPRLPASEYMRRVLTSTPLMADTTMTAVSTGDSAPRALPTKSGAPGASSRLTCLPLKSRFSTEVSMEKWWCFSSSSKSEMLVPSSTLPFRSTALAWKSRASASEVLPDARCPARTMLRMSSVRYLDMGEAPENRSQRSEVRGQRSEVRGQRSEVRGQGSEVRGTGLGLSDF